MIRLLLTSYYIKVYRYFSVSGLYIYIYIYIERERERDVNNGKESDPVKKN